MVRIVPELSALHGVRNKARACAVAFFWVGVGFYLDVKYFRMGMEEMDTFRERTQLYGDWRARGMRKPLPDRETLNG